MSAVSAVIHLTIKTKFGISGADCDRGNAAFKKLAFNKHLNKTRQNI